MLSSQMKKSFVIVFIILFGLYFAINLVIEKYWNKVSVADLHHHHTNRNFTNIINNTNESVSSINFGKNKFTRFLNALSFSCENHKSVVVLVLSETRNSQQRNVIRNTWGQWLTSNYSNNVPPFINSINYHSNQTKLLFVMGTKFIDLVNVENDLDYLKNESQYDDLMYFPDLLDTYMNLTLKTLTGLYTAREYCPKALYFLKSDTDVFINVPNLIVLCQHHLTQAQSFPIIIGNEQFGAPVVRNKLSKWYVPNEIYSNNYFPPYVTGCGYLLNTKALDNIIKTASKEKQLFYWEDVAVTGMYSTNTKIIDNKLFRYEDMSSINSCQMRNIILAHRISPKKMISLWNDMTSNMTTCSTNSNLLYSIRRFENAINTMIFG